jgi:hypothetical protein
MKKYSYLRNIFIPLIFLTCIFVLVQLSGCYSFTGGSIPDHLKTLYIASVNDVSLYGNPAYKDNLTKLLIDNFRNDNSFTLVDRGGDARLSVIIMTIVDATMTIRPGEIETERKITVNCDAEYYDAVKKKSIWKKSFSNFNVYQLSNAQVERDKAIQAALKQTSDDIMLAVVSGW